MGVLEDVGFNEVPNVALKGLCAERLKVRSTNDVVSANVLYEQTVARAGGDCRGCVGGAQRRGHFRLPG
eukprot:7719974-Lingulodinium_polyedra.AAC.1